MDWTIPVLGFFVGLLVGLTGIGGAALMTPLLILGAGVRPVIAVGTDLAYGAVTKAVGSLLHCRQRSVDLAIAARLGIGSIPMGLAGVALISWVKGGAENGAVDRFVSQAVGVVLMVVAVSLVFRPFQARGSPTPQDPAGLRSRKGLTIVLGAAIGFVVGLTSIGSGSLIAATLVTLYPRLPLRRVVGTDIFHAAFLTVATGVAHFSLGNVDLPLMAGLLTGSIPGVWLGSRLTLRVPDAVLRPLLATILLAIGYKLV